MADKDLISLLQIHELDYWAKRFGCTRDQLREAVAKVGNGVDRVEAYLAANAAEPDPGLSPDEPDSAG